MIRKLLSKHISAGQLLAFCIANLAGTLLLVVSVQFYRDIQSLLSSDGGGVLKPEYVVLTRQVGMLSMFGNQDQGFSEADIADLREQPFVADVAEFTPSHFQVYGYVEVPGGVGRFGTEMFLEAVPDAYVDAPLHQWSWYEGQAEVPIVLPRNYLNLYNFGFAQTRGLPKLSETAIAQVPITLALRGEHGQQSMRSHIVAFSNRLNTILVPQSFLQWANARFGDGTKHQPTRLIIRVDNPADRRLTQYIDNHRLQTEQDNLESGRLSWFLQVVLIACLSVGLLLCAVACYMLVISIYLLVQKNQEKLLTLRLIGYSCLQVSWPYMALTAALNVFVAFVSLIVTVCLRSVYIKEVQAIYDSFHGASLFPTVVVLLVALVFLCLLNSAVILQKVRQLA